MTDSVKLCVDLRSMPEDARREVEVHHARTQDKRDSYIGERYPKAITVTSPLSGTGMELKTFWEDAKPRFVQSHIVAALNLPNALTGHNCEHGTSIFAAGEAGLERDPGGQGRPRYRHRAARRPRLDRPRLGRPAHFAQAVVIDTRTRETSR